MRIPRFRSARLAAELAEVRDQAARAEARIDEVFAEMERQTTAADDPAPRAPRERHLNVVR
jgi:hypothetical protein